MPHSEDTRPFDAPTVVNCIYAENGTWSNTIWCPMKSDRMQIEYCKNECQIKLPYRKAEKVKKGLKDKETIRKKMHDKFKSIRYQDSKGLLYVIPEYNAALEFYILVDGAQASKFVEECCSFACRMRRKGVRLDRFELELMKGEWE